MSRTRVVLLLATVVAVACSRGESPSSVGARALESAEPRLTVRDLTGVRTRVVWIQNDGTDPLAQGENLALMGLDSDEGSAERVVLGARRNYAKPILTPNGDRIVFSNRHTRDIHVVNWDGTGLRRLAEGFALEVWSDPASGEEWIYAARDPLKDAHRRVVRFRIENPTAVERVWDKTPVGEDNFQLSPDGRLASGVFPWPDAGVAELPNGAWRKLGDGCWTALAMMDRPLCWYLDGAHRNLTLVDVEGGGRWRVAISRVPGFTGAEVYHPRWTNDPRFLTITGPYNLGGANQVRGGGPQVEVYLGRFSADFARVDQWARVTRNNQGDAYPDVWIDPAGRRREAAAIGSSTGKPGPSGSRPRSGGPASAGPDRLEALGAASAPSGAAAAERLVIEARLAEPGNVPSPRSILPYRRALVVNAYEVVRTIGGRYAGPKILVAEWAIRDGRVLPDTRKATGTIYKLTLEPYDAHPELEGERLILNPAHPDLPIYYEAVS